MAEKRHRSTKEEVLNRKILKNAEAREKLQEKIDALNAQDADLRQQLKELTDVKKKAERAAEAKAKRVEQKKAEKELIKAIQSSGMSVEEMKEKLGI